MTKNNEGLSVSVNIAATLVSILAFPIYLYFFTAEVYGAWFTVTTLAGLCGFFEMGVTLPLQQFFLNGEIKRMRRLAMGIALILVSSWLVLLVAFDAYLGLSFDGILFLESIDTAFLFLALSEVLMILTTMGYAVINVSGNALACGWMRLTTESLKIVLLVIFLSGSGGIIAASWAHLCASIVAVVLSLGYVRKILTYEDNVSSRATKQESTFWQDLYIGLDQWVLNLFNKFSIRIILLLLEWQLFQTNLSTESSREVAKIETLQKIGQAFVVYRAASIAFFAVKQGAPTYYHRVLKLSKAMTLIQSGRILTTVLAIFFTIGWAFSQNVSNSALPQSLSFIIFEPFSLLLVCISFVLFLSVELVNYYLMVKNRLDYLKIGLVVNVAASLIVASLTLVLSNDVILSVSIACLASAVFFVMYQLYWLRISLGGNFKYLSYLGKSLLDAIAICLIPVFVLLMTASDIKEFWQVVVYGGVLLLLSIGILGIRLKFVSKNITD